MRRLILTAILMLLAAPVQAQFRTGDVLIAAWGPLTNEASYQLVRYEARMDEDVSWVNAGVAIPSAEYQWTIPPARITVGSHTVYVRACNEQCGPALAQPFTVDRIVPIPEAPPGGGIRRVPPPAVVLEMSQAIEIVQAYALLTIRRPVTPIELNWLASRHPPVPPTLYTVLAVMDAAYAEFAGAP